MPKKKPATPHAVIVTEQGLEAAGNRYVDLALTLLRRKAKQERDIADLKAAHAAANKDEESELLGLEAGVQLFCETHRRMVLPDEDKKKSRDFGSFIVGFRTNPPSVAKIVSKDTWERIAERLSALPWGDPFVKTTLAVDKDEVLKFRADLTAEQLAEAGLCFAQGETFFLEPKSELLDAARRPVESEVAA
jgi:phage host-nuclease inhibitor protein Gam